LAYHRILLEQPFEDVLRSVGRGVRAQAPIAFGVAVVENAYDETAQIEAVAPADFEPREEALLLLARRWLARLPFARADLLVVDQIGKDVSGSGMDTNVVGRKRAFRGSPSEAGQPDMRHIFVRGLTRHTHGNATGVGLADFTTLRLVRSMNYRATVVNCLTAGYPEGATLPVHFETDREVVDAALKIIGTRGPTEARVIHIANTLRLEEVEISEACLGEPRAADFTEMGPAHPLAFDAQGNLSACGPEL
jgi:hypothetical protein